MSHPLDPALSRAERFLLAHGDALELLFFQTLTRQRGAGSLLEALAGRQDAEGGVTGVAAGADALRSTLRALTLLDALGLLDHPVGEAAVGYVAGHQAGDGGFGEPALGDDVRIALTGEAAGLLAKSPFARERALRAAERFLAERWSVDRVQGPSYAPILAYVHLMAAFSSELSDEVLQWCGRELERGFRTRAFAPVDVARVFLRARARALPGAQLAPEEVVMDLLAAQAEDGGWPDAGAGRTQATLDAVEALLRLS